MESGLLSLRWNDHGRSFLDMLSSVRKTEAYCDVTLVCEGQFYPVHKLVLSTCSDFFDNLFGRTDSKHPIIIVANVLPRDLEALLNYMYLGEVNVLRTELPNLMKAAELLRIKGLADPTKDVDKDTKDRKRTEGGEGSVDSLAKRRRKEDIVPQTTKHSALHPIEEVKGSNSVKHRLSDDARTIKNISDHSVLPCGSNPVIGNKSIEQSSIHRVSSPCLARSNLKEVFPGTGNSEGEKRQYNTSIPEVKEEVVIKEEGDGWFVETDEAFESFTFHETDSSIDNNSPAAAAVGSYSSSCPPWEVASSSQIHPMEGPVPQLPQGLAGSSGLQGITMPPKAPKRTFRDVWLLEEQFKDWLRVVEGNPHLAFCEACDKTMKAELTSIKRHKSSQAHSVNFARKANTREESSTNASACNNNYKLEPK